MRDDKPSATAYLIARSIYLLSRDQTLGYLVPEQSAELSRWFTQAQCRFRKSLDAITNIPPIAYALERLTIPGIRLHYALRKRYLEETARDSLRRGTRQMVVIGAGFDTLALRLTPEFKETEFFEIDHPATQREKKRVIEARLPARDNLHFVALDIAHRNLEESLLLQTSYSTRAPTLFIAEGLLMYLSLAEVDLIFQFIREHSGHESKFAFTFVEMQEGGRIGFSRSSPIVDAWLRLRGESFKWGIERAEIADFLYARGFKLCEVVTAESLRARYLTSSRLRKLPLAEGECISVAEII
ncbi:MAG TPA: SAM-dependent methyltransferase [Pyrinomonadaceae bacterium]|nr:SAM-dependent methyltransferase [Pyrinomonadaceae bacterium]